MLRNVVIAVLSCVAIACGDEPPAVTPGAPPVLSADFRLWVTDTRPDGIPFVRAEGWLAQPAEVWGKELVKAGGSLSSGDPRTSVRILPGASVQLAFQKTAVVSGGLYRVEMLAREEFPTAGAVSAEVDWMDASCTEIFYTSIVQSAAGTPAELHTTGADVQAPDAVQCARLRLVPQVSGPVHLYWVSLQPAQE
jgi:hypothetical protein